MKRVVLMVISAMICGMMFSSCDSKDENPPWLTKLIELSKTDKTGNYIGSIWLEKYKGQDIYVTNMGFGSGGVAYYFFDSSGASIINKNYEKHPNPYIESFTGKASYAEVDEEWLNNFSLNMKLNVLIYSKLRFLR
ncbi:MAG: hypothetical protein LBE79_06950 [Tannerella sp.]|jgi:hypothetical protein|nr:hypothetical protein [Tannerella sp.]